MRSILLAAFALATFPAHASDGVIDRIAGVVNDTTITLSDVYALGADFIAQRCPAPTGACREQAELEVLDALVVRALRQQALVALGQDVTPSEVDMHIDSVVQQYKFADRNALRAEVERSGVTWVQYRNEIRDQIREMKFQSYVLRGRVAITDDEIQGAYQRMLLEADAPEVVTLEAAARRLPNDASEWPAIVSALQAEIDSVRAGTRTWESLVADWDKLGANKLFSGRDFASKDLNATLSKAAFACEAGEISAPVIADGVLYALKVVTRGSADTDLPTLEEARDELTAKLGEAEMAQAEKEWETLARKRAAIRILLPDPNATAAPAEPEAADTTKPDAELSKKEQRKKRREAKREARKPTAAPALP